MFKAHQRFSFSLRVKAGAAAMALKPPCGLPTTAKWSYFPLLKVSQPPQTPGYSWITGRTFFPWSVCNCPSFCGALVSSTSTWLSPLLSHPASNVIESGKSCLILQNNSLWLPWLEMEKWFSPFTLLLCVGIQCVCLLFLLFHSWLDSMRTGTVCFVHCNHFTALNSAWHSVGT